MTFITFYDSLLLEKSIPVSDKSLWFIHLSTHTIFPLSCSRWPLRCWNSFCLLTHWRRQTSQSMEPLSSLTQTGTFDYNLALTRKDGSAKEDTPFSDYSHCATGDRGKGERHDSKYFNDVTINYFLQRQLTREGRKRDPTLERTSLTPRRDDQIRSRMDPSTDNRSPDRVNQYWVLTHLSRHFETLINRQGQLDISKKDRIRHNLGWSVGNFKEQWNVPLPSQGRGPIRRKRSERTTTCTRWTTPSVSVLCTLHCGSEDS